METIQGSKAQAQGKWNRCFQQNFDAEKNNGYMNIFVIYVHCNKLCFTAWHSITHNSSHVELTVFHIIIVCNIWFVCNMIP